MSNKRLFTGIINAAGMLILILDSKAAFTAAEEGVNLCARTIIPSIFPFLALSIFMNQAFIGIPMPILKSAARMMGLSEGTESILVSSFLGGYPAGAQAVVQHYEAGSITKETAEKLLAFTNNAGPSFIFGMISHMFTQKWVPWIIWLIHIFSAFFVSQFMRISSEPAVSLTNASTSGSMERAIRISASICGWVILFRIIIDATLRYLPKNIPSFLAVMITGMLELSNGCLALDRIHDFPLRFILCCAMLSFGGLCVTMQTLSVIKDLKIKYYLFGKGLQMIISVLTGIIFIYVHWAAVPILFAVLLFLRNLKNKCRNNVALRV